jgi:hypothetical protein
MRIMSTPWLPNGALKDGTLLLGPYVNKQPDDDGHVVEVEFKGQTHYVRYCCGELSKEQRAEIYTWATDRLSKRAS